MITALFVLIICAGLYVVVSLLVIRDKDRIIEGKIEYIRSLEHKINRGAR